VNAAFTASRSLAFLGMNNMPRPYCPAAGSFETQLSRRLHQKFVRHLHEDAGAVAGVRLATARAAMVEVHEDLQRVRHQLVGLAPFHVDNETHAAGIVLELRVVKALLAVHCSHPAGILFLRVLLVIASATEAGRSLIFYSISALSNKCFSNLRADRRSTSGSVERGLYCQPRQKTALNRP